MANSDPAARVLEALNALYSSTDTTAKEQAGQWLEAFQKTPEAWTTSDLLLRSTELPEEPRLFAAQTFRQKITYDLAQLDPAARVSLRDSLLNLLLEFRAGPRMIETQLCLSLAGLALQMQEWKGVVQQFVGMYGGNAETAPCLLEFLTVLPEEVNENHRIPISDEQYKERTTELLSNNSEEVLRLLLDYIQRAGTNSEMQSRVFQCLLSWLKSGDIDVSSLVMNRLFSLSFEALQSDKLFDVAVDVVCEVIHETKEIDVYLPAIQQIYSFLYLLRDDLIRYRKDDNEDRVRGYCRIFVEAGESYLPLVLNHPDAFRGIVEGIAECTAFHDLDIVPMTFNFWYQLATSLNEPQHQETKAKYKDVYDRLVDVILVHLRYPDELVRWTAEERDEFRNFRHVMGDTLKDCCVVLGARACLVKPYNILTRVLGATKSAGGVIESVPTAWQDIEAAIFSLRAMGAEVPETESEVMPQIMEMLGKLPDHPKIRYAATLVISRYSGWTKLHPQFIEYQLNFISVGFENEEVAAASALALKHLCRDCSELLVSFLNQLHPFFLNVTKTLPTQDVFEVTEAVAHVIAAIPTAELLKALQLFCLPVAQRLHEIASLGKDASDKQTKEASDLLEQITLFLQVVVPDIPPGQPHPCVTFVRDLWPVFDLLLNSFGNHPAVSESLCKCFKYCVVSYRAHFIPLLPQLMERLVTVFDRTQLSCYLWVATKVVREYAGEDADNTTNCLNFVEGLSTVMFGMLSKKQFSDIPDVIEEYFRLIAAFLDAAPTLLIQSPLLSSVFQAGLAGLSLEQQDTLTAVLSFYRNLISVGYPLDMSSSVPRTPLPSPGIGSSGHSSIPPPRSAAATANATTMQTLFRQYGLNFVQLLFNGLIYHFPRDVVADVAAILKMLAEMLPQESAQWMVQVVEQFPEQHMTAAERAAFLADYTSSIQDQQWKRVRRVLSDFVAAYRRKNVASRARRIGTPVV